MNAKQITVISGMIHAGNAREIGSAGFHAEDDGIAIPVANGLWQLRVSNTKNKMETLEALHESYADATAVWSLMGRAKLTPEHQVAGIFSIPYTDFFQAHDESLVFGWDEPYMMYGEQTNLYGVACFAAQEVAIFAAFNGLQCVGVSIALGTAACDDDGEDLEPLEIEPMPRAEKQLPYPMPMLA